MWHEARKTERKVHAYMDAAKVRAEKKAAWLHSMRGDPVQSLRLTGTGCKLHHDISIYRATENQEGL
jgi:arginine/serine-rich splicing factor 16